MSAKYLSSLKWLSPGMGVKRWILLAVFGLVTLATGLMLLMSNRNALLLELSIIEMFQSLFRIHLPSTVVDVSLVVIGGLLTLLAVHKGFSSIYSAAIPSQDKAIVDLIYERRQRDHGLKIVAIGGGTGLSTLLRGLKNHTSNIVAIVTVSDDGGSSGRLSKELGMLPPGDLRNCMTALADDENLLSELFRYRFHDGKSLEGHSFGNLFIAALTDIYGDFETALKKGSQILAIRGRVLPATLTPTVLCANMRDGRVIKGESEIPLAKGEIANVFLEPDKCSPPSEVFKVIEEADAIVLGPGSLYTSVIPNLLIDGVADALAASSAPKIYVCNVMTQPGETDNYSAADHLQAINHHVGKNIVDYVIVNVAPPNRLRKKYQKLGAYPIKPDLAKLRSMGVTPVPSNIVNEDSLVRHDPIFLAESIIELMANHRADSVEMPAVKKPPLRAVK